MLQFKPHCTLKKTKKKVLENECGMQCLSSMKNIFRWHSWFSGQRAEQHWRTWRMWTSCIPSQWVVCSSLGNGSCRRHWRQLACAIPPLVPIPTCCHGEEYQPDTMLYEVWDGQAPWLQASSRLLFGLWMFLHLLWGKVTSFPWPLFSPHLSSRCRRPGPQEAEHCRAEHRAAASQTKSGEGEWAW